MATRSENDWAVNPATGLYHAYDPIVAAMHAHPERVIDARTAEQMRRDDEQRRAGAHRKPCIRCGGRGCVRTMTRREYVMVLAHNAGEADAARQQMAALTGQDALNLDAQVICCECHRFGSYCLDHTWGWAEIHG